MYIQPMPRGAGSSPFRIGITDTPSKCHVLCAAGRCAPSTSITVAMKSIVTTGAHDSRAGPLATAGLPPQKLEC